LLSGGQISDRRGSTQSLARAARHAEFGMPGVVVAGFQNSHVHFTERKFENAAHAPAEQLERDLRAMTSRYGFTSVFDTASDEQNTVALRRASSGGDIPWPAHSHSGLGHFSAQGRAVLHQRLAEARARTTAAT
jgi:hypothetical protein